MTSKQLLSYLEINEKLEKMKSNNPSIAKICKLQSFLKLCKFKKKIFELDNKLILSINLAEYKSNTQST